MPLISRSLDTAAERVLLSWSLPVPRDRAWWGLTDPEALPKWMGSIVSGSFADGDVVTVRHAEDYCCTSKILECEPGRLLAMTWEFPDEPLSHLRITLSTSGSFTRLALIHEGLGAEAANYLPGWHTHLLYLEGLLADEPLPMAGFRTTYEDLR